METAINVFFDDFEMGTTRNAPYLFAPGAPYISNGALYVGLDMADPRTWNVIPVKKRIAREFSTFNRTETWVRCIGIYPEGHQAIEFTAFTFNNQGLITALSKVENKECPFAGPTTASNATSDATSSSNSSSTGNVTRLRADTKNTNSTSSAPKPVPITPPAAAPTAAAPTNPAPTDAAPTAAATAPAGKGKGKGKA